MNKRLLRTTALLGEEKTQKITNAKVMIIGVGAVGGYALEALARFGVGEFVLIDFDVFDETNINRQILALSSTIGKKKVDVAKNRVLEINSNAKITILDVKVNHENIDKILDDHKPDFIIDAIDNLSAKLAVIETLYKRGLKFISSMGAALKTDESFIKYGKLSNTKNCGLAKFLRKKLKSRGVDISKVKCVYSDEQVILPETAMFLEDGNNRNSLGSLPTITAIFGLTIANNIIKEL
ncbi:MAG: tRNA threonylcarbamoyladenosine dehydratase [Alphaproteobacteria bacterium]